MGLASANLKVDQINSVWKTIRLGTGLKTAGQFRSAIKQMDIKIGNWAIDILNQPAFTVSDKEREVDLVNVSVADLGFGAAYRRDIIAKALEIGLELCPAEVGPQLRLQYPDQPKDDGLVIGMEPITDSEHYLRVFGVERDGVGRWLRGAFGDPGSVWEAEVRFVFILPRK